MSVHNLEIGTTPDGKPFTLPEDLGDKKFAFLAQSKKGKTYGLGDILEELTVAHRPWCAFDPANNLWGLRVLPDGSPSHLPIIVVGGDHGDLPLEKDAGERLAEAWLSEPSCIVFDLAFESKNVIRKFVTSYCNRIMQTRSTIERVIFFEEAPELVPQRASYSGIQVCKAAVDRVVRIGGNFGYGTWLVSQRSATLDKDVLSQCEALIVMGLTDTRDRKAVKEWMVAKDIDEKVSECFEELGSLKPGEAWLWWPAEDRFERFTFRPRRTLHPREMKRLGLKPGAVKLGDVRAFVDRLKKQLTRTQVTIPADDKTHFEKANDSGSPHSTDGDRVPVDPTELEELRRANVELLSKVIDVEKELRAERERAREAERRLEAVRARLKPEYEALQDLFADLAPAGAAAPGGDREVWTPWLQKAGRRGCRRMLEVLIERGELTRNQLGTLSNVASTKSTFRNYLSWLKGNGLVETDGEKVRLKAV